MRRYNRPESANRVSPDAETISHNDPLSGPYRSILPVDLGRLQEVRLSPLVQSLGPIQSIHGIAITPVRIQLLDQCELQIMPAPTRIADLLRQIHGTQLYTFTGLSSQHLLTSYVGISQQVNGSRVVNSFRQWSPQMLPAGLALLTRPQPYGLSMLRYVESATVKHSSMRTRPLNTQSNAGKARQRLSSASRALADALAQQIADALTVFALGGDHNPTAWHYPNARDHAAALIHRLGGRSVDSRQVVQMLTAAGAQINAEKPDFTARRDLVQREPESGNARISVARHGKLSVYYPTGVITEQQALADYAQQRQQSHGGWPPIPTTSTGTWCPCRFCTPITTFSPAPTPALAVA